MSLHNASLEASRQVKKPPMVPLTALHCRAKMRVTQSPREEAAMQKSAVGKACTNYVCRDETPLEHVDMKTADDKIMAPDKDEVDGSDTTEANDHHWTDEELADDARPGRRKGGEK